MIQYFLIIVLFFSSCWASIISGYILDSVTKQAIPNANVYIRSTGNGTESDVEGYFTLEIYSDSSFVLEISHIGYSKQFVSATYPFNNDLIILLEETYYKMHDLVVTGTRRQKILQNTPIATEVINENIINNSGVQTIGQLLSLRSGVSLSSSVEGGSVVNIMGMDSKYILILVDGQPIVGKFNGRVSLDQIPIQVVKKIEIIKGPNSSLYGSEAMGGVINIITKDKTKNSFDISYRYDGENNNFNPINLNKGNRTLAFAYMG